MDSMEALSLGSSARDSTRAALVRVALDLFGAKGFEATSIREIAKAAGANIAAIAYYFGGKEGLRNECANFIVQAIRGQLDPVLSHDDAIETLTPSGARARLIRVVDAMIAFIVVSPQAEPIARFMIREMSEPSGAFDLIHGKAMAPIHKHICALWAQATGVDADSEETLLSTLAMLGQVIYFRIARQVVLRRMAWPEIGSQQAATLRQVVVRNLEASIDAARKSALHRRSLR